jgi:hypothetical protein
MDHRLHATSVMAEAFHRIFVNRRAYTLQSAKPHRTPDTPEGSRRRGTSWIGCGDRAPAPVR